MMTLSTKDKNYALAHELQTELRKLLAKYNYKQLNPLLISKAFEKESQFIKDGLKFSGVVEETSTTKEADHGTIVLDTDDFRKGPEKPGDEIKERLTKEINVLGDIENGLKDMYDSIGKDGKISSAMLFKQVRKMLKTFNKVHSPPTAKTKTRIEILAGALTFKLILCVMGSGEKSFDNQYELMRKELQEIIESKFSDKILNDNKQIEFMSFEERTKGYKLVSKMIVDNILWDVGQSLEKEIRSGNGVNPQSELIKKVILKVLEDYTPLIGQMMDD